MVHMVDEVPEGSGRLRFRWQMKFRMVPAQIADRVAEVSGAVSGAHSKQKVPERSCKKPSKLFQAVGDNA